MKSILFSLLICAGTLQAQYCNFVSYGRGTSFETGLSPWSQETANDNANWTRHSGATPSSSTGPTSAPNGSYYMYIETSTMPNHSTAILNGPCVYMNPGRGPLYVQFYYHMYGADVSYLSFETRVNNGPWNSIWIKTGPQGNQWHQALLPINYPSGAMVQFRFRSGKSTGYRGDVAIDDFYLGVPPYDPSLGDGNGGGGGNTGDGDGNGGIAGVGRINPNSNINQTMAANGSLSVVPNPFNNQLNIQTTLPNVQGYRLTNLQGIILKEGNLQRSNVNVQDLPTGVYFITVYNTEKQLVQKVIKQ